MRCVLCAQVALCLLGCASKPVEPPPTAPTARPAVMGSLSREEIEAVVRANRGQIKRCYEQELQKNHKLAGTVQIKFMISGTGTVLSALVSDTTMQNAAVEQCMVERVRSWIFPPPRGGIVIVNYPFNFSS